MDPQASKLGEGKDIGARATENQMELIEGGDVTELKELEVKPTHREATARWLAIMLVLIFGGSVFLHYVTLAVFAFNGKTEAADKLSTFFNTWLPAITALVGAATTYYFTKEKR